MFRQNQRTAAKSGRTKDSTKYFYVRVTQPIRGDQKVLKTVQTIDTEERMNRKKLIHWGVLPILIFGLTLFLGLASFAGDNWYENKKWVDQDPYSFNDTYMHLLFPDTGVHVGGRDPYLYAILAKSRRDAIWAKGNHAEVIDSRPVKKNEVQTFHDFFAAKSDIAQMPYWAGGIGLIPLKVTSAIGAASTLLDVLLHFVDSSAGHTKASELAATMAVGGTFERFYSISVDQSGHEYLSSSVVYEVQVGDRIRSTVISSATYALKVE